MERANTPMRHTGIAVCSALAAALLGGFVSQTALARSSTEVVSTPAYAAQVSKEIEKAEQRVARTPNSAARRGELAHAYLAVGRFESAASAFRDAQALGDDDARTALGLALASIGSGRNADALQTLTRWRDRIPASDLGLAVALAGQPEQGVAILTDVVRGGENTPKARQNLAYAYALSGQWSQARIIAAQDVPGDQLDARMTEWARAATQADSHSRVAALLGTPRNAYDPGVPRNLALGGASEPAQQMAVAVPQPVERASQATQELPAVAKAAPVEPVWSAPAPIEPVQTAAMTQPEPVAAPAAAVELAAATDGAVRFVSNPIVQRLPEVRMSREAVAAASAPRHAAKPAAVASSERTQKASAQSADATHLVQLGSFRTMEGAQRAWGIFVARDPRLKDHTMRITEAMVAGRRYYRVAAEGFDRGSARSMCSSVKSRGNGCLAYAETNPLPGVLPSRERGSGPLRAR